MPEGVWFTYERASPRFTIRPASRAGWVVFLSCFLVTALLAIGLMPLVSGHGRWAGWALVALLVAGNYELLGRLAVNRGRPVD